MLQLAVIALAITSHSIAKAPAVLRVSASLLFSLPAAIGYGVGYFASQTKDTRIFYPIGAAIVGWIVGAVVFDALRKRQLKGSEATQNATLRHL